MKPFDLEAALRGEKVVTRKGVEVFDLRLSKHVKNGFCLSGVLHGQFESWREDGLYFAPEDGKRFNDFDLFMAPKTIKRWLNFYGNDIAGVYESEDAARKGTATKIAIAIAVPVEFEEGYGK